jgi:SAM-dependent methyltransferase
VTALAFQRGSTSAHRLNADRDLRKPGRALWSAFNRLNKVLPYSRLDERVEIRDFLVHDLDPFWPRLAPLASPARALSDLFWMTLLWAVLAEELDGVRVLDIGCGEGRYGARLDEWSGGRILSYLGVDAVAHSSWPEIHGSDPRFGFVEADAASMVIPDDVNLVVSQSSLEHVSRDETLFARLRDRVEGHAAPIVQVHLVPGSSCRRLYVAHGIRQYTPRTLSRCTRIYGASSRFVLFRLGGERCAHIHRDWIARRGSDDGELRETNPQGYNAALRGAIEADMREPQRSPVFLALTIASCVGDAFATGFEP